MGIKERSNEAIDPSIALIGGIDYDYIPTPEYRKIEVGNTDKNGNRSSSLTGAKLNYLEGTKNEIAAISNLLTPLSWKIEVFTGSEAKEENIMRLEGKYAKSILHIATHGYAFQDQGFKEVGSNINSLNYNYRFSKNPMVRSGLILSGGNWAWTGNDTLSKLGAEQNGILTALEVSQLNLKKTKLVVLSACETGLGQIESSEGTFGLKRGFKLAGVEQIIVSLWSVPDKETMELMNFLYAEMSKSQNPVKSFESAQEQMRKKHPNNPLNWAGFVLVR
jgi:CHAT domain-containing protein